MRNMLTMTGLLAMAFCLSVLHTPPSASADPAAAKAELHQRLEQEIAEFCRTVHQSMPSIPITSIIEEHTADTGDYPNLVFEYKRIGCHGEDMPALQQCGFCGLARDGMACAVKTFAYRDGRYEEVADEMRGIFE